MISTPMVCLAQTMHLSCTDTNTVFKQIKMRFNITHSPRSSIRCVQNDFQANGMFGANRAPILHRHWLPIDRNEIPLDPRHLGVPSGVSKTIFRANGMFGANRAPILHQHWLPTDRNEIPLDPHHLGVPSGASKTISEPMVCSAQTVHLSCTDTGSQQTETRFHRPTSPRSTIGCVQNDF